MITHHALWTIAKIIVVLVYTLFALFALMRHVNRKRREKKQRRQMQQEPTFTEYDLDQSSFYVDEVGNVTERYIHPL